MKVLVDSGSCMGHGRCYTIAPDVLDCDDEGYVTIRDEAIAWPEDQRALADEIAGSCPEGAISLIDD